MAMSVQQAYDILNKLHGYTGPRTKTAISNFINARDIPIAVKNKGGIIGYQEGGDVDPDLEKVQKGQKKLVTDIATDPTEAVEKATVTDINPETKGAEIGDTKGQAKSTVDKATATKIADEDIEQATEPTATAPKQKVKQKLDADGNPVLDAEG